MHVNRSRGNIGLGLIRDPINGIHTQTGYCRFVALYHRKQWHVFTMKLEPQCAEFTLVLVNLSPFKLAKQRKTCAGKMRFSRLVSNPGTMTKQKNLVSLERLATHHCCNPYQALH